MTIESFLSTKSRVVTEASDGRTLVGAHGNLSAHGKRHAAADLTPQRHFMREHLIHQLLGQALSLPTIRRTQGATIATVGKATGHVVRQLLSHCARNPECTPCEIARTKADTMQTMMAESKALKRTGAKRAGIRISFS
jgi:hypothetical protein